MRMCSSSSVSRPRSLTSRCCGDRFVATFARGGSGLAPSTPLMPTSLSLTTAAPRSAFGCFLPPRGPPSTVLARPSVPEPRLLTARTPLSTLTGRCPRALLRRRVLLLTRAAPSPPPRRPLVLFACAARRRAPSSTLWRATATAFYSCIAHALQPLDSSLPGPTAAVIRAQTCAHMTKYSESYAKLWDGVDDHGQGMESFHDYIKRMQANGSWAGGLELLACARAHKLCIVMLAERPDLPPCCFNPKPGLPRVALWHTKDHYDLLLPAPPATELPSAVTDLSEETSVRGDPPCWGWPCSLGGRLRLPLWLLRPLPLSSCEPSVALLPCVRTRLLLRGLSRPLWVQPSVASSAPTSLKRARLDLGASASVAPPGPAAVPTPTAGNPASPVPSVAARPSSSSGGPSGIRAYFCSSAVPSGPPTGPALPGDTDSQCLSDVEPPPEAPAEPRRVPYGKSGRFRVARSWPCPLCDYKTPTSVKWSEQKRQHISNYHRETCCCSLPAQAATAHPPGSHRHCPLEVSLL